MHATMICDVFCRGSKASSLLDEGDVKGEEEPDSGSESYEEEQGEDSDGWGWEEEEEVEDVFWGGLLCDVFWGGLLLC
jgi:hypothetical protein